MIIAVDYDGVLNDQNPDPGRKLGRPLPGALETMTGWANEGHTLIVHTVRGDDPAHVEDWLRYFGIPFHTVTRVKPNADVFLDDKALRFHSWHQAREAVAAL